jgi:hypothetical protein
VAQSAREDAMCRRSQQDLWDCESEIGKRVPGIEKRGRRNPTETRKRALEENCT